MIVFTGISLGGIGVGCSGSTFGFSSGHGVIIIGGDSRLADIAFSPHTSGYYHIAVNINAYFKNYINFL